MSIIYQEKHYTIIKWTEEGAIIQAKDDANELLELNFSDL
tara:strand:- start:506 stop:625 length:120 start_codon:yes stop_codon:yes gene_type:complete